MPKSTGSTLPQKKSCPSCGLQLEPQATVCPRDGTNVVNTIDLDPAFAKYEFLESIGAGGMGIIYKARHVILNKVLAIKTLHSHIVSPEAIRRFQLEGKATSSLTHPNIISVHDFGVTDAGQAFMVMDFVNGCTLADVLRRNGHLPINRFLAIFIQVCDALSYAHKHSILHRDIKPSNIMIVENESGDEEVRIMDFGIAKILTDTESGANQLTKTGDTIGSPVYMSPEQARGAKTDIRSDLYSLGCVMYEAISGSPPFAGNNALETLLLHLDKEPVSLREASMGLEIDRSLEVVVMRLLKKNADDRYQSMDELKDDLIHLQNPNQTRTMPKGSGIDYGAKSGVAGFFSKKIIAVLLVLALAGCLLIFTANTFWHHPAASVAVKLQTHSKPVDNNFTMNPHSVRYAIRDQLQDGQKAIRTSTLEVYLTELKDSDLTPFETDATPATKEVVLKNNDISDLGLNHLKGMKDLLVLDLSRTKVQKLNAIVGMEHLQDLSLESTKLLPEAFANIRKVTSLQKLNLQSTPVTDQQLLSLASLKNLKSINISMTNLSLSAANEFKEALPTCVSFYSPNIVAFKSLPVKVLLEQARADENKGNWSQADAKFFALIMRTPWDATNGTRLHAVYESARGDCLVHMKMPNAALALYEKAVWHFHAADNEDAGYVLKKNKRSSKFDDSDDSVDDTVDNHYQKSRENAFTSEELPITQVKKANIYETFPGPDNLTHAIDTRVASFLESEKLLKKLKPGIAQERVDRLKKDRAVNIELLARDFIKAHRFEDARRFLWKLLDSDDPGQKLRARQMLQSLPQQPH